MHYLVAASLIWAFSFGLIKGNLAGVDAALVTLVRLALSLLVFVPFLRLRGLSARRVVQLLVLGAVQYGVMYVAYIAAFAWLQAHEVALLTAFTPLFVVGLEELAARRLRMSFVAAAVLAVAGALVVTTASLRAEGIWKGVVLVQVSNLAFAWGQVRYRQLFAGTQIAHRSVFALLYLGGLLVAVAATLWSTNLPSIELEPRQMWTLLYLGLVPSGLCFFLWNVGATRTNAGALAVFNNAKIPLGVLVSLVVFGEQANVPRLLAGCALVVAALGLTARTPAVAVRN